MEASQIFLMTREIILFTVLLVFLVLLLLYYRRYERRRMKKRIFEAMSPELKKEIDEERRMNLEKKQKFEEALKSAGGGKK